MDVPKQTVDVDDRSSVTVISDIPAFFFSFLNASP